MSNPQETVIDLFVSTDQQNWESVKNTFHPKVLLDYSSMTGSPAVELSPDQIVEAWKAILPGFEHTHHQLGNFRLDQDGEKANVSCYGTATHFLTHDEGNIWTVVGSYDFTLIKDKKRGWRVSSMTFHFKYQDGNLSLPEKAINKLK